jgi:hypothetical protein
VISPWDTALVTPFPLFAIPDFVGKGSLTTRPCRLALITFAATNLEKRTVAKIPQAGGKQNSIRLRKISRSG